MTDDDVMTKDETMAFVAAMFSAAFRYEQIDQNFLSHKKYIDPQHLEDALDRVTRLIYEKYQELPPKVTDDFETREAIQQKVDELTSGIVRDVRQALEKLKKP